MKSIFKKIKMNNILRLIGLKDDIKITSYNLTEDELIGFITFWQECKHMSTQDFVILLYRFTERSECYDGCKIDISDNEVSLSRSNFHGI